MQVVLFAYPTLLAVRKQYTKISPSRSIFSAQALLLSRQDLAGSLLATLLTQPVVANVLPLLPTLPSLPARFLQNASPRLPRSIFVPHSLPEL